MLLFYRTLVWLLALQCLPLQAQVVPLQANIDAQAQRRLQEQAAESRRQGRRQENIKILVPALSPENLTGAQSQAITRRALAALFDLSADGFSSADSLQRAASASSLDDSSLQATRQYLQTTWQNLSTKITPDSLPALRAGQNPKPGLIFPAFQP